MAQVATARHPSLAGKATPAVSEAEHTPSPDLFFRLFADALSGRGLRRAVYQFVLLPNELWTVSVGDDGRATAAHGRIEHADCTIKTTLLDIIEIGDNRTNAMRALMSKRIVVDGNRGLLAQLVPYFKDVARTLAAQTAEAQRESDAALAHSDVHHHVNGVHSVAHEHVAFVERKDWQPDNDAPSCVLCKSPFTFTHRRHHCRLCGRVVCADCSARKIVGQRVCDMCHANSLLEHHRASLPAHPQDRVDDSDPQGHHHHRRHHYHSRRGLSVGGFPDAPDNGSSNGTGSRPPAPDAAHPALTRTISGSQQPNATHSSPPGAVKSMPQPSRSQVSDHPLASPASSAVEGRHLHQPHGKSASSASLAQADAAARTSSRAQSVRTLPGAASLGDVTMGHASDDPMRGHLVAHSDAHIRALQSAPIPSSFDRARAGSDRLPPEADALQSVAFESEVEDLKTRLRDLQRRLRGLEHALQERPGAVRAVLSALLLMVAGAFVLAACNGQPLIAWDAASAAVSLAVRAAFVAGQRASERWTALATDPSPIALPGGLSIDAPVHSVRLPAAILVTAAVTLFILRVVLLPPVRMLLLSDEREMLVRRVKVYTIASRIIAGYMLLKLWTWGREGPEIEAAWSKRHAIYSVRVRRAIVDLKGFWVKVGQYLSSRPDILPGEWVSELKTLQDEMPASGMDHVRRVIREDFSKEVEDLFASFDEEPIAAASIAQVHCATLRNGERVVVKVQHPRMDVIMRQDMANLAVIMRGVAWLEPKFDFRPVVDEWSKEAIKELDFFNEARNMTRVADNLERSRVDCIIPKVTSSLVSARVLTMEYVEGFKVTDVGRLKALGIDRAALLSRICQAYASQVYVDGFFNADPHPGNILVSIKDGIVRPVLLDFGLTKALPPHLKRAFARMVHSAMVMDSGNLLRSFEDMGLKLNRTNPSEDMNNIRFLLRDTAPAAEARSQFREYRREQMQKLEQLPRSQRNPVDAWPGELLFFFRVTFLLRGLCSALETRIPFVKMMGPYAHRALLDAFPAETHAREPIYATPSLSSTHAKVEHLLRRLHAAGAFLGIQVAVYKDGVKVVDAAAGVMGLADPRPVTPLSLFNGFSVTKAVSATAVHILAGRGLVDYDAPVASYWPAFAAEGKRDVTVRHVMAHTAGLESAAPVLTPIAQLCDYEGMLRRVAAAKPSSPAGQAGRYHYYSFGWLCGGVLRGALNGPSAEGLQVEDGTSKGKKAEGKANAPDADAPVVDMAAFVRDEIARPLGIESEFYLGCVPVSEWDRIATLANGFGSSGGPPTPDDVATLIQEIRQRQEGDGAAAAPQAAGGEGGAPAAGWKPTGKSVVSDLEKAFGASSSGAIADPCVYNARELREGCVPAANGHFSARALARFYDCIARGGVVPLPSDGSGAAGTPGPSPRRLFPAELLSRISSQQSVVSLPFLDEGMPYGLGFRLYALRDTNTGVMCRERAIGHSGLGGSIALCDLHSRVSVAVTVNRLSFVRDSVNEIVGLVLEDLAHAEIASLLA